MSSSEFTGGSAYSKDQLNWKLAKRQKVHFLTRRSELGEIGENYD